MATSKRPRSSAKTGKIAGRRPTGSVPAKKRKTVKKKATAGKAAPRAATTTARQKKTAKTSKSTTKKTAKKVARRRPTSKRSPRNQTAALKRRVSKLTSLLDVAKAMTAERDLDSLLKLILDEAVRVVVADRCTLWIIDRERNELWTKVAQGLGQDEKIRIPVGVGIAGQVAQTGKTINIPDAYADPRFNRQVDRDTGYNTRNILAVAMFSTNHEVTGVLQALNKLEVEGDRFIPEDEELLLALGANAAAAIENAILYEEIDRLFEGFVKASVVAIESRDPTTSGHSERVAKLTTGIAENVERISTGRYRDLIFTYEDMREIRYAALLHDFGKVGVREDVLTKANKLYPGQIDVIETRFTALRAQRENRFMRTLIEALREGGELPTDIDAALEREFAELDEFLEFIHKCNRPTVLDSGGFERLREVAKLKFDMRGNEAPMVNELELQRLSIPRGSLDPQERIEIESHVTHTFRFLAQIPWTRSLRRVPEIAYAHHEKLDGLGYPRQLLADQIPVQSRMMTIADIYDALTASDRPYKKAVPHEKALDILHAETKMKKLDPELLEVFIDARVFERAIGPVP